MNEPVRFDLSLIKAGIPNLTTIVPQNIMEIGSRDGYDSNYMADDFKIPHQNCIVFEPVPKQCKYIMDTYPNMKVLNNAISSVPGIKTFTIDHDNIGMSSLMTRHADIKNAETIEVECIDAEFVINELGLTSIDVCKIDVEGAALDVLKSFGKKLGTVKSFQIECELEQIWEGQSLYFDVTTFLKHNGFDELMWVKVCPNQVDAFWVRNDCIKN